MLTKDRDNCGSCGHSCLGGGCANGLCLPITVARDQESPLGIFVPSAASQNSPFVFWVNQGGQNSPSLRRASKDGSNQVPINDVGDQIKKPFDLAVSDEFLYWSEGSVVFRRELVGGTKKAFLNAGGGEARFLALDGNDVFVAGQSGPTGVIVTDKSLYTGTFLATGLAVSANLLFWIQQDTKQIVSGPTMGGPNGNTLIGIGTQAAGLAVDGSSVDWTEDRRRVLRAGIDDHRVVTVFESPEDFGDSDVAVDDKFVYWTESASGFVRRLAK
jgi:hypothetical protein